MTYAEAVKAMEKRTPVIYTGPGSMGRGMRIIGTGITLRGSDRSIGIIGKIKRTKAVVYSDQGHHHGMIYHIKHLYKANPVELKYARAHNKRWLPNLKFNY